MARSPEATIAIVTDGDHRLARLLASIAEQSLPLETLDVVVIENGVQGEANQVALPSFVRRIQLANRSMPAARNAALQAALGPFFLSIDADAIADRCWAEQIISVLRTTGAGAVGGLVEKYDPRTWVQRLSITIVDGQQGLNYLPAMPLPYVAGVNAGYVTDLLRAVGGFDEELLSGNDVDICYRLGLAGHGVVLASGAIVYHEDRATLAQHFQRFRRYAVYQVLLFAKYRGRSGKCFVLNGYPLRRTGSALAKLPSALLSLILLRPIAFQEVVLILTEAVAIWCGDIEGSIRYRQLYI
jgi:GT2 family glycosyltransferase